jgi:hypothetical protein
LRGSGRLFVQTRSGLAESPALSKHRKVDFFCLNDGSFWVPGPVGASGRRRVIARYVRVSCCAIRGIRLAGKMLTRESASSRCTISGWTNRPTVGPAASGMTVCTTVSG